MGTVSYTHLDVYKRQPSSVAVVFFLMFDIGLSIIVECNLFCLKFKMSRFFGFKIIGNKTFANVIIRVFSVYTSMQNSYKCGTNTNWIWRYETTKSPSITDLNLKSVLNEIQVYVFIFSTVMH